MRSVTGLDRGLRELAPIQVLYHLSRQRLVDERVVCAQVNQERQQVATLAPRAACPAEPPVVEVRKEKAVPTSAPARVGALSLLAVPGRRPQYGPPDRSKDRHPRRIIYGARMRRVVPCSAAWAPRPSCANPKQRGAGASAEVTLDDASAAAPAGRCQV